ncbi:MAG: hypothetical protein CML20_20460 [Rheinheimera sp.]|nr:hypothetical protein [Rheinheimera sp.]
MGGRSKSSQSTSNKQVTNNIVNDGDYAGVGGNVTHDESSTDNSINDSYNTDNSQEWDVDIDNSQEWEIDNSISNDGDFAGNNGNINILDGGAIESAFDFASDNAALNNELAQGAINANTDLSKVSIESAQKSASDAARLAESVIKEQSNLAGQAFDFSGDAIESLSQNSNAAIDAISQNSSDWGEFISNNSNAAIDAVSQNSSDWGEFISNNSNAAIDAVSSTANSAIDNANDLSKATIAQFSEFGLDPLTELSSGLIDTTQTQLNNSAQTLTQISGAASNDKAIIAELAKNTALQGQDIIAEQAGQMVKYVSFAIGFVGLALVLSALSRSK